MRAVAKLLMDSPLLFAVPVAALGLYDLGQPVAPRAYLWAVLGPLLGLPMIAFALMLVVAPIRWVLDCTTGLRDWIRYR